MFNPKRLSLAKSRRRLTSKALAEKTGLAQDTISRLETGITPNPDETTVLRLSQALGFPITFFEDADPEDIDTTAVSFRSFSKMSAKERDAAVAAGSLGLQLNRWVEGKFALPKPNLIDLSYERDPEVVAGLLRQHWGLGERPISSMLGLLETHGVRVFSLSENTASVNAFSFWRDGMPYVFLNNYKTAESSIFDTAHELGHLVMHRQDNPKEIKTAEREANAFAAAFLMPSKDVRARIARPITIANIISQKARWRVAAMALVVRLDSLKILTEWQYRSLCIELGRRGYRTAEPIGVERETSIIWRKVLAELWSEKTTKASIARDLHLPLDELEGLIWNLAAVNTPPERRLDGKLRVVSDRT